MDKVLEVRISGEPGEVRATIRWSRGSDEFSEYAGEGKTPEEAVVALVQENPDFDWLCYNWDVGARERLAAVYAARRPAGAS